MTCIVALSRDGKCYMGGDSAGVDGWSLVQRADQKVFEKDGYLFGFTTSFRMGQLLRYRFEPPRRHEDDDLFEYMATDFVDEVRECLKKHGFAKVENQVEEGGEFLVCVQGRIFNVQSDFQIGESVHPFAACGCGESIALGALHAILESEKKASPNEILRRALQAAEAFSSGVRGPFTILESADE